MGQQAVSDALDAFFNAKYGPGAPNQMPIAADGYVYTPVASQPYLAPRLAVYLSTPAGAGPNAAILESGTYSIQIMWPSGEGKGDVLSLADGMVAYFKRATTLALATGGTLVIQHSTSGPPDEAGDWLSVTVNVLWLTNE